MLQRSGYQQSAFAGSVSASSARWIAGCTWPITGLRASTRGCSRTALAASALATTTFAATDTAVNLSHTLLSLVLLGCFRLYFCHGFLNSARERVSTDFAVIFDGFSAVNPGSGLGCHWCFLAH